MGEIDRNLVLARYNFASRWTKGHRIYEIGCGKGWGSLNLKANKYIGIDGNESFIKFANENYADSFDDKAPKFQRTDPNYLAENMVRKHVVLCFDADKIIKDMEHFIGWSYRHGRKLIISISPGSMDIDEFRKMLESRWKKVALYLQDGFDFVEGVTWDYPETIIAVCEK